MPLGPLPEARGDERSKKDQEMRDVLQKKTIFDVMKYGAKRMN